MATKTRRAFGLKARRTDRMTAGQPDPRDRTFAPDDFGALPARPDGARPRLLVVDDNETVLALLTRVGRLVGFDCDTATSLADARWRVAASDYDALVVDLNLRGELGSTLLDELAHARHSLARRAIVLTADLATDPWVRELIERGVPVLHKPFQLPELERHLRAAIAV